MSLQKIKPQYIDLTQSLGNVTGNTFTGNAVYGGTIGNTGASLVGTIGTATQNSITTMTGLTDFGTAAVTTTAAGNFTIAGNLTVNGTTATINSTTLTVDDLNIVLASGAADAASANGAGITIDGASATLNYISSSNTWTFDRGITVSGTANITTISGNLAITNYLTGGSLNGNIYVTGNVIPTANVIYNLGNTTSWFDNIYGKASQALYADLAENYTSDCELSPGDVVVFGGSYEITTTIISHDDRIAGVISTNPAYLMNSKSSGYPVGLQGRVPCRVLGPVNKGQSVVSSTIAGVAQALDKTQYTPGCVIGKSLEKIVTDEIRTVEVVVGRL